MTPPANDWVATKDRWPSEGDLPVLLWNASVPKAKYCATPDALRSQRGLTCFSHWMPAPQPPKVEPTQGQIDGQMIHEAWRMAVGAGVIIADSTQHAFGWVLLSLERAAIRELLARHVYELEGSHSHVRLPLEVYNRLAKRVGLAQ